MKIVLAQRIFYLLAAVAFMTSCSSGDDTPQPPEVPLLVFPENNTECLEGIVSADPNVSTITFRWQNAARATSYNVIVENLISGRPESFTATSNSLDISLERGQPYEWRVEAISNELPAERVSSIPFKFYNAGDGIVSYAPFPADLTFPRSGESVYIGSGNLKLQWEGADVDNDITGYEVFLSTTNPPSTSIGESSDNALNIDNLALETVYYWQVVTSDNAGNSSRSEVSEFRVR